MGTTVLTIQILQAQLHEAEQSFGQEHNGGSGDGDGDGAGEGGDGGVGIAERMNHRPEAELMQVGNNTHTYTHHFFF
jgi:hypothetical protein